MKKAPQVLDDDGIDNALSIYPYRRLAAAMIARAYSDIAEQEVFMSSRSKWDAIKRSVENNSKTSALRWVKSDSGHFLSFKFCCQILELNLPKIRLQILSSLNMKKKNNRNSHKAG